MSDRSMQSLGVEAAERDTGRASVHSVIIIIFVDRQSLVARAHRAGGPAPPGGLIHRLAEESVEWHFTRTALRICNARGVCPCSAGTSGRGYLPGESARAFDMRTVTRAV